MEKPTIEEIEALLDGKEFDVVIMPNGEIKAACKNCLKLKEKIVELEQSLQQAVKGGQADTVPDCSCGAPSYLLGPCVNCGGLAPAT